MHDEITIRIQNDSYAFKNLFEHKKICIISTNVCSFLFFNVKLGYHTKIISGPWKDSINDAYVSFSNFLKLADIFSIK